MSGLGDGTEARTEHGEQDWVQEIKEENTGEPVMKNSDYEMGIVKMSCGDKEANVESLGSRGSNLGGIDSH